MKWLAIASVVLLAACAGPVREPAPELTAAQARALAARAIPPGVADGDGWAADMHAAFTVLGIAPTPSNLCAAVAVIGQESGFQVDPPVPGLADIAWREIDLRAARAGLPAIVVRTALRIPSPDGRSYAERIDAAKTEQDLSRAFDDMVGSLPLGRRLFGGWNPVRTGGPMQVGIAFAEAQAREHEYPYPVARSLRDEVFTRRGGLYFGIAHLLDYPADYDAPIYRFADYNAGRHASRNAAFQNAVSVASGIPLDLDGDLIAHDGDASRPPGATELAVRSLAARLDLDAGDIRRALEQGDSADFARTDLYRRVFALADRSAGRRLPRAMLPVIALKSPKIRRPLTTEWFARRVDERHRRCLARLAG
ncbi:DUF1615 domain-containing protein [Derxia gummosa]|uniref:DUF1615 domain-containing protein n=1 Tax=Derxia gummosa DSM 723 TaxID=1121388 RepID=A0A8B6X181_9BURK|nr:DUF1615 domain-containing protein [Derxia gummosa]